MTTRFETMDTFEEMAEAWADTLADHTAATNELSFQNDALIYPTRFMKDLHSHGRPTRNAYRQLGKRLDVPGGWLADAQKCPPQLRELVLNWKFAHHPPKEHVLRTRSRPEDGVERVRAVLTTKYGFYDHLQFVRHLRTAIEVAGYPRVGVYRPVVKDHLSAYLVIDAVRLDGPEGRGGGLCPAVYIGNSEIGTRSVRIAGGVFREICSNGAIAFTEESSTRVVHRGGKRGMVAKVSEAITRSFAFSEELATAFLEKQDVQLERGKLAEIVDSWGDRYGLTVRARDLWRLNVEAKADRRPSYTQFDLINAATSAAHDFDGDTRERIETMGGDLMLETLPEACLEGAEQAL